MRNIRLLVEYDGTNYHGFQRQPEFHGPTIQGALEDGLRIITGEGVKLAVAGRTDAGVHALGQVVNFFSSTRIPLDKLPKALNSNLPYDVRVKKADYVPDNFNARFSACWKRYRYTIYNGSILSVFHRLYCYHVPYILDLEAMQQGAALMIGRKDFRAFCASGSPVKDFVRTLTHCEVRQDGQLITIDCQGDGFLYNMVRIISGTLVEIGKGRINPRDVPGIIAAKDRAGAGVTAPPHGLCLIHVEYNVM